MKFEQFSNAKVSENLQNNEYNQDEKVKAKKPKFFRNLKMAGIVSLGMLASSGHAFSQEKIGNEKKNSKQTEFILPTSSWKFVEDSDSILAENDSKVYPGLVENYIKNEEGKYELYQHTDRSGNIVETPETLLQEISIENEKLAEYANPEEWAKKQFIYQKTLEFKTAVLQKYITETESRIIDLIAKLELFNDNPDYSAEDRKLDEQDIDKYKKSLDYFKKHPEELLGAKEKSFEELTQEAENYKVLGERHIKSYQEQLDSLLEYIDQNK